MAEINNLAEINENFDTIKTLLNSIRAQGILNTSDVDKLLSGINSKLEKINTDEDVNLIKLFLTDLKQGLEERHNVLVSKFGAIESLFSNLLKNSSEMLKSSEVKELFDIVATNLSVFSREVVSQKESLTDIMLRLDAIQSDDSQKKEIIKSVSVLKGDIERISNGFDSIVLSLNENFKTVIKTISELDKTDSLTEFGTQLTEIISSSNTILSALQLIDKKQSQLEDSISSLPSTEDMNAAKNSLLDIYEINKRVAASVDNITDKGYKIDSLSEKIDASVNVIAGLKAVISEIGEKNSLAVVDRLNEIEEFIKQSSSNDEFETLKSKLEIIIKDIINECILPISGLSSEIKEHVDKHTDKISQLLDANTERTINDLKTDANTINSRLKETQTAIAELCSSNFSDIIEGISGLKTIISQIDENNVSGNNAIFSNITDRLALFENSLKNSLEKQEEFVSGSSDKVVEQMTEVKNLSGTLDYKLDASIIEINNSKKEFEELKNSVQNLLNLDFINVVKDLRVDLYAVKQDLANAVETSASDSSEKFSDDLFGKYELLISKLDNLEDEVKKTQLNALEGVKTSLDNISSGIVDILSYVSVSRDNDNQFLDSKIEDLTKAVNDSHLNYVENVRDVVEIIKIQVDRSLSQIQKETGENISSINKSIETSTQEIQTGIKNSYDKLIEVQGNFDEIKEKLDLNHITNKTNLENILDSAESLKGDFESKLSALKNVLLDKVSEYRTEFACENADKISELKFNSENLHSQAMQQTLEIKNELKDEIEAITDSLKLNVSKLAEQVANTTLKVEGTNKELVDFVKNDFTTGINNSVDEMTMSVSGTLEQVDTRINDVVDGFSRLGDSVQELSKETTSSLTSTLAKILDNFVSLKSVMASLNEQSAQTLKENTEEIKKDFDSLKEEFRSADSSIDEDLARQINIIEQGFQALNSLVSSLLDENKAAFSEKITNEFETVSQKTETIIREKLDEYKSQIEASFDKFNQTSDSQARFIGEKALELNNVLEDTLKTHYSATQAELKEISERLKQALDDSLEASSNDYKILVEELNTFSKKLTNDNNIFIQEIKTQLDDVTKFVDSGLSVQAQEVNNSFEQISTGINKITESISDTKNEVETKVSGIETELEQLKNDNRNVSDEKSAKIIGCIETAVTTLKQDSARIIDLNLSELKDLLTNASNITQNSVSIQAKSILEELLALQGKSAEQFSQIKALLKDEVETELLNLGDKIHSMFEENSLNYATQLNNTNSKICDELRAQAIEIKAAFEALNERMDKDELSQMSIYQNQVKGLHQTFNSLINEAKDVTKSEVASICETLVANSKAVFEEVNQSFEDKITSLLATNADISAGELQTIEAFATDILEKIEGAKHNTILCKDMITSMVKEEIKIITKNIEKETDVISGDIIEQISMLKDAQKDDLSIMTDQIEGSVAGYIMDSVNDLKAYLDLKTDTSIMNDKIDNLRTQLDTIADSTTENLNKIVELSVFSDAIADLKSTNEVLVNSMANKLNEQVETFIKTNVSQPINEKLNLFDKKFVDMIVDKYEEVKLIYTNTNDYFNKLSQEINELISEFKSDNGTINSKLEQISENLNGKIDILKESFDNLKVQLFNQSEEDEQTLQEQIKGIENIVEEQTGYLEDISELCCNNLPEISEMSAIVKHGIMQSISDLETKIDSKDFDVEMSLNKLKSEIITQFLNIFNQISFVTEQEEILDFIQEKHSELITILSHIVTTSDGIENVKDNLSVVDTKVDSIKEDVNLLNEKLTAIMSSDGNIDYVYSLQDLESDIANLRLVLNEMKESLGPKDDAEDFKQKFNEVAEDILSISTRTNKLILASDESSKSLQDNLNEFKLVINDLDERTRNFAQEVGMDRIDNKLGAINTMIQNGEKTNQIYNQIFEYLAEWVDKAGAQINSITDKVETLDDIGQIKVMLEDLKTESEDNSESDELVEALSNVFDKQAKKISSLETKLDRLIVDNTINNRAPKLDVTPFEDTLNKFLVAIDDKMTSQQRKINTLEEKLEEVMSLIDNKDTAQLTKKVGGMDRQIAKLNKSIEKIASHVTEK